MWGGIADSASYIVRPMLQVEFLTRKQSNPIQRPMQGRNIAKTSGTAKRPTAAKVRQDRPEATGFSEVRRKATARRSGEGEGIDMAAALHGIIGKYESAGENKRSCMKQYGRTRNR